MVRVEVSVISVVLTLADASSLPMSPSLVTNPHTDTTEPLSVGAVATIYKSSPAVLLANPQTTDESSDSIFTFLAFSL